MLWLGNYALCFLCVVCHCISLRPGIFLRFTLHRVAVLSGACLCSPITLFNTTHSVRGLSNYLCSFCQDTQPLPTCHLLRPNTPLQSAISSFMCSPIPGLLYFTERSQHQQGNTCLLFHPACATALRASSSLTDVQILVKKISPSSWRCVAWSCMKKEMINANCSAP